MINKSTQSVFGLIATVLLSAAWLLPPQTQAAVISDDFSKPFNSSDWTALGTACLTARSTSVNSTMGTSSNIPGCNFSTPEAVGSGALRLTPNTNYQRGSIVSNYTFPTNQGLQVTFTTYTFSGDSGGTAKLGADGMSFFLMDGSVGVKLGTGTSAISNLGGSGGSLSYSCSNTNGNYSGVTGGYLGLGMDEYGNFLNSSDNTSTGVPVQTASSGSNGYNSWGSGYQQPNRIGLRGAGNVSWYWLNQNYPVLFPSSFSGTTQQQAVQGTCRSGYLWDARGQITQNITTASVSGNTLSLTMPSVTGISNGDSVTLLGNITATAAAARTISGASTNGTTTLAFTVTGGNYSQGQTVTLGGTTIDVTYVGQTIASFSNYSSSGKTFRINLASGSSTSSFAVGNPVYVSGIGGNTSYPDKTSYTVADVKTNYITVGCLSLCNTTYPSFSSSSKVTPGAVVPQTLIGNTFTTASGTSGTTVNVTLPYAASGATTSAATMVYPAPTVVGASPLPVVTNLSSTGFDVTLNYPAGSVTNTGGTVSTGGHATTTAVQNYAAIAGGYWVLPSTQPMANDAKDSNNAYVAVARTQAVPITYKLTITPSGSLSFLYSYNGGAFQQVLNNWPITASNGALPSSFRFGFTGATGGSNNYHDITCFLAEPVTSSSGSGGNAVQAGQFKTSTQIYTASYDSYFWTGSVTAVPIALASTFSTTGAITLGTATWDGNCVLTGGGCGTTGVALASAQGTGGRQLLTWNGTQGIPFAWSSLTSAQQTTLNWNDSGGSDRVDWLRGVRSKETTTTGITLRSRSGILGDVVDSSPTWVGPPSANYGTSLPDGLYGTAAVTASETSHAAFNTSMATRLNMVYVGSNDGFLHGFRTGKNKADGTYDGTLNDGSEMIGFMPSSVMTNSTSTPVTSPATPDVVNLTKQTYGHSYFVDAAPGYGDLYYGGAWHTWLVGGMGPGGQEIYTLDITDPESGSTSFAETKAAAIVKGDWTPASLTALTCVNATANCGDNLGNTFGTPLIRRLHNGKWAIIFGNGYSSTNKRAGIFIGVVEPTTTTSPAATAGTVSFYWLDTGSGSAASPNGIANVSSADLDGDHITDYLYAGDMLGKLWRFDLTSKNPADWAASKFGMSSATPLFDAGTAQPITTQITTTVVALQGLGQRVMLGFGTGQAVPFTATSAVTYSSGTQSVYGIWDWDMTAWNNGTTAASTTVIPASAIKYAALAQLTAGRTIGKTSTDLQAFTVTTTAATATLEATRSAQTSKVCWQGSSACGTGNTQYGWLLNLPVTGEQLIYSPTFESGALVVNTTIPPGTGVVGQCTPVSSTGWTMAIDMGNGGGFKQNVFADASGSYAAGSSGSIMGIQLNLVGKTSILTVNNNRVVAGSTSGGTGTGKGLNLVGGLQVKRVSWEQIR